MRCIFGFLGTLDVQKSYYTKMNMSYQQIYPNKTNQGTNPVEVNGKHVYPKNQK